MTTTLRELLAERHVLDALIEDAGGDLTVNIEQAWDATNDAIREKVESWGLWITRQEHLADAIDVELDRLKRRKAVVCGAIDRSKDELHRQMEVAGLDKVKGVLVTVALQKNQPSVRGELAPDELSRRWRVASEDNAQPSFVRRVDAYTLDRKAVLEAHKAGQPIPEGLTVVQTTGLRIR